MPMHQTSVLLALVFVTAADDMPLTPAEAAKKVNEKVTVEMEVKSTGGKTARFLNSATDFKDDKNFTVFIPAVPVKRNRCR
jgi:hypothetical protein